MGQGMFCALPFLLAPASYRPSLGGFLGGVEAVAITPVALAPWRSRAVRSPVHPTAPPGVSGRDSPAVFNFSCHAHGVLGTQVPA
jgi:hypothetical protein